MTSTRRRFLGFLASPIVSGRLASGVLRLMILHS